MNKFLSPNVIGVPLQTRHSRSLYNRFCQHDGLVSMKILSRKGQDSSLVMVGNNLQNNIIIFSSFQTCMRNLVMFVLFRHHEHSLTDEYSVTLPPG